MEKSSELVRFHMDAIGGQKLTLPILTSTALWKKSGRLEDGISEFFVTKDRHGKEHLLSPTHEESIASLLAMSAPISYKQLPLLLYQIGPKFRDELKARFGLMRAKEFLMKDMYTFDKDIESAQQTYSKVNEAYLSLFEKLQVPYVKVLATTGIMGGSISHEYHFISQIGEDRILKCKSCGSAFNEEVLETSNHCQQCKSTDFEEGKGMEIGHTFLLGDKYSKPLGATFLSDKGKPVNMIMGCYGIGVTRMVAASLECLSTENELKWPTLLAPYDVCIILPKEGSKEEDAGRRVHLELENLLSGVFPEREILVDDRNSMTIGKRLMDAKRMGYPIVIVVGAKSAEDMPTVEFHFDGERKDLNVNGVCKELVEYNRLKKRLLLGGLDADENKVCAFR